MLAGAGAAAGEGVGDEPLDELVGERDHGGVVGNDLQADVEVAVAGVAEDRGLEAEALQLGAGERDGAGGARRPGRTVSVVRSWRPGEAAAAA